MVLLLKSVEFSFGSQLNYWTIILDLSCLFIYLFLPFWSGFILVFNLVLQYACYVIWCVVFLGVVFLSLHSLPMMFVEISVQAGQKLQILLALHNLLCHTQSCSMWYFKSRPCGMFCYVHLGLSYVTQHADFWMLFSA